MFLIEMLWICPDENRVGNGYEPFAYADSFEEARDLCNKGRLFTGKDCWSLRYGSKQEFRFIELKHWTKAKKTGEIWVIE